MYHIYFTKQDNVNQLVWLGFKLKKALPDIESAFCYTIKCY